MPLICINVSNVVTCCARFHVCKDKPIMAIRIKHERLSPIRHILELLAGCPGYLPYERVGLDARTLT